MRKLSLALVACLLLGTSAKACNPVIATPAFGFSGAVLAPQFGGSFTPFGFATPAFGFNTFGFNSFGANAFATPFGFGGVNVAVATGGFRARNAVVVRGGGRTVVRTRTVVRGR